MRMKPFRLRRNTISCPCCMYRHSCKQASSHARHLAHMHKSGACLRVYHGACVLRAPAWHCLAAACGTCVQARCCHLSACTAHLHAARYQQWHMVLGHQAPDPFFGDGAQPQPPVELAYDRPHKTLHRRRAVRSGMRGTWLGRARRQGLGICYQVCGQGCSGLLNQQGRCIG
jgi:hypothetical protein